MNSLDRSKYRGEMWTKKFKDIRDPWQTCNREYGDWTPRKEVVRMENEIEEEEGPWIASTYQMGYNTKPEFRHKWMDSWKGYVKRKKPAKTAPYKSLKNIEKGTGSKSHPGVRLPPIAGDESPRRQEIRLHEGSIYMATPRRTAPAKSDGVNERFFNFRFKDHWKPQNLR